MFSQISFQLLENENKKQSCPNFLNSFEFAVIQSCIPESEKFEILDEMEKVMINSNICYGNLVKKINTLKNANVIPKGKIYRTKPNVLNNLDKKHLHKMFEVSTIKEMLEDRNFGRLPFLYAESLNQISSIARKFFEMELMTFTLDDDVLTSEVNELLEQQNHIYKQFEIIRL